MSLENLKEEVSALSVEDRKLLIGYMLELNNPTSAEEWARLEAMIDDKDLSNWVTGEELERQLAATDS